MRALCAEKLAIGPRKRLDCSSLQSIGDKKSANRDQASSRYSCIEKLIEAVSRVKSYSCTKAPLL